MRLLLISTLWFLLVTTTAFVQIRRTASKEDEILTIRTALGIATIVQLSEVIQSVIIGDQSGFKIEYIDKAITIKPLRPGAKTNLYLITNSRRFNIRLVTGLQEVADYVVYLTKQKLQKSDTKWKNVMRSVTQKNLKLSVVRIGQSPNGFILIDALLTSSHPMRVTVKPEFIWVKQGGKSNVINSLFMSDSKIEKAKPLRLGISLAKSDLVAGKAITIEFSSESSISLQISEVVLWK